MDRMDELTEMIKAGWGDMRTADIPLNWREITARHKAEISLLPSPNFSVFEEKRQAREAVLEPERDLAAQCMFNENERHSRATQMGARKRVGRPLGKKDSKPRYRGPSMMREAAMRARMEKLKRRMA